MQYNTPRRSMKFGLVVLGSLFLSACASHLNQQQCASMNWYQVGYNDGVAGQYQQDLHTAIQDCAKFGMTVDATRYQQGWQAGVKQFCQPEQAEQLGTRGQTYNPVCPANLSAAFDQAWRHGLRRYCIPSSGYNLGRQGAAYPDFCAPDQVVKFRNAYDDGYRIYNAIQGLNQDINNLNSDLDRYQRQVHKQQRQIDDINQQLKNPSLPADQRQMLMQQARELNTSNLQLRDQISRLEGQRVRLQQQQHDYETR